MLGEFTQLLGCSADSLKPKLEAIGQKPFRAKQILQWLHQRGCSNFEMMTDLSKSLRESLGSLYPLAAPTILRDHVASDSTRKWLFDVGAGNGVESVFIPELRRGTLCVSTQVGCAVACSFCSTGAQGFNRNLSAGEIIAQVWLARSLLLAEETASPIRLSDQSGHQYPRSSLAGLNLVDHDQDDDDDRDNYHGPDGDQGLGNDELAHHHARSQLRGFSQDPGASHDSKLPVAAKPISNVVFMGMGEPLQNYEATLEALRILLSDYAYGLSRRRVTVSTSGVVPMIDRLAQDCPVALAVSLHAPDDALRDRLVPLNRKYPLAQLMAACQAYLKYAPRDFITFEYTMMKGVNDSLEQAEALVDLLQSMPSKVNLIPFNPFPGSSLQRSDAAQIRRFGERLLEAGITATIRKTRGDDIDAACGQLAGEVINITKRRPSLAHRTIS